MSDIVERLRSPNLFAEPAETQRRELVMAEAAAEITRLREELALIAELDEGSIGRIARAALKPVP